MDTFKLQINQRKQAMSQNLVQYFSFKKHSQDTIAMAGISMMDSNLVMDFDLLSHDKKRALVKRALEVTKKCKEFYWRCSTRCSI